MKASSSITISHITDGLTTHYEYAKNESNITAPSVGWSATMPSSEPGKFIWRREAQAFSIDEVDTWGNAMCLTGAKGDPGIQGPAGTPGFLGLYAVGETLHLKGYGADGVLNQSVGYIYVGGERIAVPATSLALTGEGTGYILFNNTWTNKVVFAKMTPQPDTVDWIAYNNPSATAYSTTNTYVIGKFQKDNTGIHDEVIISPVGCNDYTTAHFMEIIATEDWASFQAWAEALNVTQTFERLAAYEAFIGKLFANKIELSEGGAIYSGYSADGTTPPPSGSGFWLGASGLFKAYFAELLGTLRTGLNAPTDARVAIQDESGITSGPTFTGSGLNDMSITKSGEVAGNFRVKISAINNATNSGKLGYWATPFQVGTNHWNAIAVNSSGRFVAGGWNGYMTYSNDGITWATPFKVGNVDWNTVAVNSSGRFVAVGSSSYASYSNDGINWATPFKVGTLTMAGTWSGIAVNSSGRFVAIGSGYMTYSDDGITWATPFQTGGSGWEAIGVNSSGRFVAGGWNGYISYSDDGINWATPFRFDYTRWRGVAGNSSGRFVAVGGSSIMNSLLQDSIKISSNGGTTWGSDILIPLGQAISITGFGIDISFGHVEGHTVGDYWSFTQGAMRGLAITDSAGNEYLSASNGEVTLKKLNATTVDATTVNATTVNATTVYGAVFN